MVNRYWTGQLSNVFNDVSNWEDTFGGGSPASSVPGSGDTAHFLAGGADCTLDGHVELGGLATDVAYSGAIDLDRHDLTGDAGASFTFAHSGDLSLGTGTLRIHQGTVDWSDLGGTLDRGTSCFHFTGSSQLLARDGDQIGDLIVGGVDQGSTSLTLGPGTLYIDNVTLSSTGTSSVTLDTATNGPELVVLGDLTFALADTGAITVDQAGQDVVWKLCQNVVCQGSSPAGVQWQRGTGEIHAAWPYAQQWDWSAMNGRLETIVVNKPWNTLTLASDVDCNGWQHTRGSFAPAGHTLTCHGDFIVEPGGAWPADSNALDGCALVVSGNLSLDGRSDARLRLRATASWTLTVQGSATARYVEVAYCDASDGSAISADDGTCVDLGGNVNWQFHDTDQIAEELVAAVLSTGAAVGDVFFREIHGEILTPGAETGDVHG